MKQVELKDFISNYFTFMTENTVPNSHNQKKTTMSLESALSEHTQADPTSIISDPLCSQVPNLGSLFFIEFFWPGSKVLLFLPGIPIFK